MLSKGTSLIFLLLLTLSCQAKQPCFQLYAHQIPPRVKSNQLDPEHCFIDIQAKFRVINDPIPQNILTGNVLTQDAFPKKGLLAGIPVVVKDIIDVKGTPTTAGTAILQKAFPQKDADIITRLKNQGAMIVGKGNLHELSGGVTSMNPIFGYVKNPYNPNYFTGGSSGGPAAAVAQKIVPVAIGSDTAGSTRIPAALSGVYGFKPTLGRYSVTGVLPIAHSLDTLGIMANSIDDIILVDSVLALPNKSHADHLNYSPRIGIPTHYFYDDLDPQTDKQVKTTLGHLKQKGVTLVDIDISDWIKNYEKINMIIILYEAKKDIQRYLITHKLAITFDAIVNQIQSPDAKAMYQMIQQSNLSSRQYKKALARRKTYIAQYEKTFAENKIDGILFPTTLAPANTFLEAEEKNLTNLYTHNTIIANTTTAPALTIPIGFSNQGLPIAIEIDGLPGEDRTLLSLGKLLASKI